jgi:DNA-binding response OmpR family regulator
VEFSWEELRPLFSTHLSFHPTQVSLSLKSSIMPPLTPRILIIDDANSSELVKVMLKYSDTAYEITVVQTPTEGLRLAAAQRFDLFVLDYFLPGMSGAEVCRTIRQTDADTPIMFFSGGAYEHERREAMQAGANDYLVKPDDLQKLTGTVKRLTGQSKPPAVRGIVLDAYPARASVA